MAECSTLIVVDTSVVSLLIRGDQRAAYYQNHMVGRRAVISFQTLEELWFGAYKGDWGDQRKNGLRRDIDQYEVVSNGNPNHAAAPRPCGYLRVGA